MPRACQSDGSFSRPPTCNSEAAMQTASLCVCGCGPTRPPGSDASTNWAAALHDVAALHVPRRRQGLRAARPCNRVSGKCFYFMYNVRQAARGVLGSWHRAKSVEVADCGVRPRPSGVQALSVHGHQFASEASFSLFPIPMATWAFLTSGDSPRCICAVLCCVNMPSFLRVGWTANRLASAPGQFRCSSFSAAPQKTLKLCIPWSSLSLS